MASRSPGKQILICPDRGGNPIRPHRRTHWARHFIMALPLCRFHCHDLGIEPDS
jgi:hypothetical protein